MICQLCLKESDTNNSLKLFDEVHENLNVASIITKHFWFEPYNTCDDKLKIICMKCWSILENFHHFYEEIKNAHIKWNQTVQTDIKLHVDELKIEIDTFINQNNFDTESNNFSPINFTSNIENFNDLDDKLNLNVENELIDNDFIENKIIRKSTRLQNKIEKSNDTKKKIIKSKYKIKSDLLKNNDLSIETNKIIEKEKDIEKSNKLKETLENEDKFVSNYMKLTCSICSIEIGTFTELKRHYTVVHNEVGYAVCCEKKFLKRCRFMDHIKMHICPETIRCNICGRQCRNQKGIKSHIKNVHSDKGKKFGCDECDGTFTTKGGLTRHKLLHIPEDKWKFKCKECDKCFPSTGLLRTHMITTHENRYGGICDLCGKKYQSPNDLKRHRLEHDGIRPPKAQCEICGYWVINKYKLKRHMIIHMTGNFKCNLCDKIATNALALKSHIQYTHMKKRNHKCTVCSKVFRRNLDLKEHMTVHTGEALYVCPHCPRTFTHHSNMHHHRKKMHRKEFDEERKYRGVRQIPWTKETELKKPTTINEEENFKNIILINE